MRIALIHRGSAYKPEIYAYIDYFQKRNCQVDVFKDFQVNLDDYQVEWHFMGLDRITKQAGRIKVHEYTSLSIPPYPKFKNWGKKQLNPKPDLRVFHTPIVESNFNFKDNVASRMRGPGLGNQFFEPYNQAEKPFDFIYVGAMEKVRQIDAFLNRLCKQLEPFSLLMVGAADPTLKAKFESSKIEFTGKVAYQTIPKYLKKAKYGLNLMPDIYPFNIQPSYKLLEYCAINLKIISTDYQWARLFEKETQSKFFFLDHDFGNLNWARLEEFEFKNPNMKNFQWETSLEQSGIFEFLQKRVSALL